MRVGLRSMAVVAVLTLACALVLVANTPPASVQTSYAYDGFTMSHPAAWRSYPYEAIGSLGGTVGYLSKDPLSDPCHRTRNTTNCQNAFLLPRLSANGVLVEWFAFGSPGRFDITTVPGEPLVMDGMQARLGRAGPADESCLEFGGTHQVVGTVAYPPGGNGVLQMWVCFGPRAGRSAELAAEQVFRSLTFDRVAEAPEAPTSHGSSARLAESLHVV